MRRLNFQDSFGAAVEGYDAKRSTLKVYERRVEGSAPLQALGHCADARCRDRGVTSPPREGATHARAQCPA